MTRARGVHCVGGVHVNVIGYAFDQIIRGACDMDYVDAAIEDADTGSRGGGGAAAFGRKLSPGCVALNADSYRYFRTFFMKILTVSRENGGGETGGKQVGRGTEGGGGGGSGGGGRGGSGGGWFLRSDRRRKVFDEATKKMIKDETFLSATDGQPGMKVRIR